MSKKIIRFTGSPDSNPDQWLRINHLTEQPGPGSAYRVTIEPIERAKDTPLWFSKTRGVWVAGITEEDFITVPFDKAAIMLASGEIAVGPSRETALRNLEEFEALREGLPL